MNQKTIIISALAAVFALIVITGGIVLSTIYLAPVPNDQLQTCSTRKTVNVKCTVPNENIDSSTYSGTFPSSIIEDISSSTDLQSTSVGKRQFSVKYNVPRSVETMSFELTFGRGQMIEGFINKSSLSDRESREYHNKFNNVILEKIKGKTVEDLKDLSRVGGASLTTGAFVKALQANQ
jgi:hypothetical protein